MTTAAKISILLEAQTASLQKGFGEARSAIDKLSSSMSSSVASGMAKFQAGWLAIQGTIRATRGLISSFSQSVNEMSEMQDWADRLGMAADELAVLGYAAEQTGSSQETLNLALQKMQNNLSDAGQEGGTAIEALNELGISANQMRKLAPEKQFAEIAKAMGSVANQGDRTRLTLDIFGKSGGELNNLLREGTAGLEEYGKQAEQLGLRMGDARKYMEAFGDELHKIEVSWKTTKQGWAASWAIVLADPTNTPSKILSWVNKTLFTQFRTTVGSTKYLAKKAAEEVEQQLKKTEKKVEKSAEKIKESWKDIPKPQDYETPGIGAVTRGSAAGFSAVQEATRRQRDQARWEQQMLAYQMQILAAIKKDKLTVATVNL